MSAPPSPTVLAYTFRTFPALAELQEMFNSEVFIFGKLRDDLVAFKQLIDSTQPDIIFGTATAGRSRFEPIASNRFGRNGSVIANGPSVLPLATPYVIPKGFSLAAAPTHTFCNWTMYQIQTYLQANHPNTRLVFAHTRLQDIKLLRNVTV